MKFEALEAACIALVLAWAQGCSSPESASPDDASTPTPCDGITCSGHGVCALAERSPVCACSAGYHPEGLSCVEDGISGPCSGVSCSDHGVCVEHQGQAECRCDDAYHAVALTCVSDADPCGGVSCSGHGTCVAVAGAAVCTCATGYQVVDDVNCKKESSENSYLEPVSIPAYDATNPDHFLISSEADWSHINDEDKKHFYVEPGDYTALGNIALERSGEPGDPRTLSLYNGNDNHPAQLQVDEVAQYGLAISSDYWIIDRPSMQNQSVSSGKIIQLNRGSAHCIINRMYTYESGNAILIKGDTEHHTIQRSYFRDMRLSSRKSDICAILIQDSGDSIKASDHKFIDIDGKNQCDVLQVAKVGPTDDKQYVNVEGLIISGMNGWYTPDIYTDGHGQLDPNGTHMYAEGAIDLKGGSDDPANPVVVTDSHFWGGRRADGTDSHLSAGGGCGSHLGTKNIHFNDNVFFDNNTSFGTGDPRNFDYDFVDSTFNDNLLIGRGEDGVGLGFMISITETNRAAVQRNAFIEPGTGSGGASAPKQYWARFAWCVDTVFNDNVIVAPMKDLETRSNTGGDYATGNHTYGDRTEAGLNHDYAFTYERYTAAPKTMVLHDVLSSPQ